MLVLYRLPHREVVERQIQALQRCQVVEEREPGLAAQPEAPTCERGDAPAGAAHAAPWERDAAGIAPVPRRQRADLLSVLPEMYWRKLKNKGSN